MLFAGPEQEAALGPMFDSLEEKLQALYTRPYLALGSAEKALLMLDSLMQVCPRFFPCPSPSKAFHSRRFESHLETEVDQIGQKQSFKARDA